MDAQILRIVGQVAGIGGLALGVLLLVFREVIRLKVFPQLARAHAYKIIRLILLLVWSVALAGIGAWVWVETSRSRQPQVGEKPREPSAPSYRVAVKYAVVTNHRACGDSSSAQYAGMEPQWALKVNGDLVSSYEAPQQANFKAGSRIPASGSLIWTPQSETDYLRFDGDVCDLDGDPPRCHLKGSIQESLGILDGKVKLADGTEPKFDDEGYLVLDANFESDCGFSIHVEIAPLA